MDQFSLNWQSAVLKPTAIQTHREHGESLAMSNSPQELTEAGGLIHYTSQLPCKLSSVINVV